MAGSKQYGHHRDEQDATTSTPTEEQKHQPELLCYTPESAVPPSDPTLSGKLPVWLTAIQEEKWWQKLAADSTSKEKSCLPYWNGWVAGMSQQLWSPIKTGSPDSDLTSSSGTVSKTVVKSWFSTTKNTLHSRNWLTTSSPSSTALVADSTDSESTKLQSRKIRIYPQPELEKIWKKWQAACRYCYNQAIAYQRQHGRKGKKDLRNIIMQSDLPKWVKECPCHIRQNAIFEAWSAYKKSPNAKFRSVRDIRHTLQFNNSNYSRGTWYPKLTNGLSFTTSEPIPGECEYGTELMRLKDRWYAIFPEQINEQCSLATGVIALDPGVRTFLTGFDGNSFTEFGAGDFGRITRLCQYLDDLSSRLSKVNAKRRRRMRMAAFRMRQKIRNLVDECHKQVTNYLIQHYRVIFLPTFETADMVAKAKRKIGSKTARAMLTWAHYRFKGFLKFQAAKKNAAVVDVSEAYTSKTCTLCGHIHKHLGGAKVFKCTACGHRLPRDWNGAFGIFLRALRDTAFLFNGQDAIVTPLDSNVQQCSA